MTGEERIWLNFYDSWVEAKIAIPSLTYIELLEKTFEKYGDKPALRFLGASLGFRDLDRYSLCFADFLIRNGLDPGDVVAVNLPNTPQYLIAHLGALRAGCLPTGLSPLLSPKEMAYQLNDCRARVLVTLAQSLAEKSPQIQNLVSTLRCVVVCDIKDFRTADRSTIPKSVSLPDGILIGFWDIIDDGRPQKNPIRCAPQSACLLQYTGGTTGLAKGALLTDRNLVADMMQFTQWLKMEQGSDVYLSAYPFNHLAGLTISLTALWQGNTQIIIPNPRDIVHICSEISDHHPSVLAFVPSLYQMLLQEPRFRQLDFSHVRTCLSGAAPFDVDSMKALEELVGEGKIVEVYGLTETFILTMNPYRGIKKIGTVGIPLQSTHVRIVDLDSGSREMPIGEEGELIARGPQVMAGYFNRPEETARTLREFQGERWIFTGDVARMDGDGYLTIVDRTKDMINVGGYKVFSRQVEEVLYEHPAVGFCAVVGRPNPASAGNEMVAAIIQIDAGYARQDPEVLKNELTAHCKQSLALYKVPKIIEFVEQIPLTPIGKVDKKVLKA